MTLQPHQPGMPVPQPTYQSFAQPTPQWGLPFQTTPSSALQGTLPGREPQLASWNAALGGGPDANRVPNVIMSAPGTGASEVLGVAAESAQSRGFAVIRINPLRDAHVLDGIITQAQQATARNPIRKAFDWGRRVMAGGNLSAFGFGGGVSLRNPEEQSASVRRASDALARLADQQAKKHPGGGVALLVEGLDRMDPAQRRDYADVLADLERRHPGSNVPSLASSSVHHRDLAGPGGLDLRQSLRGAPMEPTMTADQIGHMLVAKAPQTFWTNDAVDMIARLSDGNPELAQTFGTAALRNAPNGQVGVSEVVGGIDAALDDAKALPSIQPWDSLSVDEKQYVTALGLCEGRAEPGRVDAMTGMLPRDAAAAREGLIAKGLVNQDSAIQVSVASPALGTFAAHSYGKEVGLLPGKRTAAEMIQTRDSYVSPLRRPASQADRVNDFLASRQPGRNIAPPGPALGG